MKLTIMPILALSLLVGACQEISDEIPKSERGNTRYESSGRDFGTDDYYGPRRKPNYQPASSSPTYWKEQNRRTKSFKIKCPNSEPYSVSYMGRDGDAIKTDFGGSQVLGRVRSASGEKYGNGEYEIWLNGNEAMLTNYLGNTVQCRVSG